MKLIITRHRRWQALRSPQGWFFLSLTAVCLMISVVIFLALLGQIGRPFPGFRLEPTLTISAVNDPSWAGPKAGLVTYDRILAVNGKPVLSPAEFQHILNQTRPGTALHYTIQSRGSITSKEMEIPVRPFTFNDFIRSFLTLFLIGLGHIAVGLAAYLINPVNPIAKAHLLMTLAIGMVSITGNDFDTVMLLPRACLVSIALTGATCLHVGLLFPKPKAVVLRHPRLLWIPYLISFVILGIWQYAFRPLGYAGYQAQGLESLFELNFVMYDLALSWSLIVGFMGLIAMIVHAWRTADSALSRNQAKVALFGAAVAYLPMPLLWLIPDQLLQLHLDSNGALATLCWMAFIVFPLSIAYAIVRHKMFDIDFVIKQSMTYTSLLVLLGSAYVLLATGLQQLLQPVMANYGDLTAYMLTTAAIVLVFEPVKNITRGLIDRRFFRTQYNFREALSDFVETARATIDRQELTDKLAEILDKTIHPKHMILFLKNPLNNHLKLAYSQGMDLDLQDEIALDNPSLMAVLGVGKKSATQRLTNILNWGSTSRNPLPILMAKRVSAQLPELSQVEQMSEGLTIPLLVKSREGHDALKDEVIGLISLGEKRSETDYTIEDRQLLQNIAQQLALTLHSAQLADEVAEKMAIKQTLLRARLIQKSMLPATEMQLSGFEVTGFSESADETGGDYYDWYDLGHGQFIVGVGDVTGHGIDSALIVAMAKSCLYNQVQASPAADAVMAALNRTINNVDARRAKGQSPRLMTFIYSVFNQNDMTCTMASAGHWFPYLYRADELNAFGEFKGTFPLGRRPADKFTCQTYTVHLQKGDVLLYFTDGLHEAVNSRGEEFGMEQVETLLKRYGDLPAAAIRDRIRQEWEHFRGEASMVDDMTLVVVRAC